MFINPWAIYKGNYCGIQYSYFILHEEVFVILNEDFESWRDAKIIHFDKWKNSKEVARYISMVT